MANKVSFIIQFKDKFGRTAEKANRAFSSIKRKADKASSSVVSFAKRGQASLNKFGKAAAKAGTVMTAALTVPIGILGKQMVDAASDAEETANKFNEIFKGIGGQATSATQELTSGFNLATSSAQELLSDTGDLLVGLGLSRSEALKLSSDVVKLSADVASFKNVQGGTARASSALTKALLGEREMLKETFKTAVREEEVKKRAAVLRFKNRKLTEQQAKALATLAIVTERNKDAIGDLARTQESYANVARRADEATKEMRESFGRLMLPIAVKVVNAITKLANWLNELSPRAKKIVLVLAGLVAIGGPLLIVLGGIATAVSLITLPVLAVTGAVLALIAAGALLALNWDDVIGGLKTMWLEFANFIDSIFGSIGDTFTLLFEGRIIDAMKSWFNVGIKMINRFIQPLDFLANVFGLTSAGTIKIPEFSIAPTAPSAQNGTVSGNIEVTATGGAQINKTTMTNSGSANLGMNMAGA